MNRTLLLLGINLALVSTNLAFSQTRSLPDPFDANAAYIQTVHASPNGNDDTGLGTIDKPFRSLARAARNAKPGTDILLHAGNYSPGTFLYNLEGTVNVPIRIRGESSENPTVFSGGSEALHLIEPCHVVLENLLVEGSTGNGINIDDGGTYDTPAEYVILRNIVVRNMNASGNNDGIKLSGLDRFLIESCTVSKPGVGGSGIDMVGCHDGILAHNRLSDIQTSGIQAKGGCARLLIYANRFEHAGARAVNMGGSTGMQYFRPLNASSEASNITVWANLFLGSETPIAFVGCENGLFAQNTLYLPGKWVGRILQENNDSQLIQCRNNVYTNNIIVFDEKVSTFINVGPNTKPETFIFANNLWYHKTNPNFDDPGLPTIESNGIIQKNPMFVSNETKDFHLAPQSPAIAAGGDLKTIIQSLPIEIPNLGDLEGQCWNTPPSVGAFEGNPAAEIQDWKKID